MVVAKEVLHEIAAKKREKQSIIAMRKVISAIMSARTDETKSYRTFFILDHSLGWARVRKRAKKPQVGDCRRSPGARSF